MLDNDTLARIVPNYKPQPYTFIEQMHKRDRDYNVSGRYEYINAVEEFDNDLWSGDITFETPNKPKLSELRLDLLKLTCEFGEEAKISIGADYIFAVEYPVLFDLKKEEEIPNSRGRKADWYWGFKQAVKQRMSLKDLISRENDQGKITFVRTLRPIFVEGYVEGCIYKYDESDYAKGVINLVKNFRDLFAEQGFARWFCNELDERDENYSVEFRNGWKDARHMIGLLNCNGLKHDLGKKNPIWGTGKRIDRFFEKQLERA